MWLLYIGPEVIAPVLSALAALGGVMMMFWRQVVAGAKALVRRDGPAEKQVVEDDGVS
jgi:hypothetical protein